MRRIAGRGRALDVATHYDLVELSLVDNPSNPDALGISIVRDAVPNLAMLAPLDYSPPPSAPARAPGRAEQDTGGQPAAESPPGIAPDHDTGASPGTASAGDASARGEAGAHLTATSVTGVPATRATGQRHGGSAAACVQS